MKTSAVVTPFSDGDESLLKKLPAFLGTLGLKNTNFDVISWIPVLMQEWELDAWAVLIRLNDDSKLILYTDHGALVKVDDPKSFLKEHMTRYKAATLKCEEALKVISKGDV